MREQGRLSGSNKLTDGAGRVLRGKSPMRVTGGPHTEGKEVLGGYYVFNADDLVRHRGLVLQKSAEIHAELSQVQAEPRPELPEVLRDDELCMIFLSCHPALARDSRVALSLKAVSGFSVKEIARAFLCDPATIAQRLVRAKRRMREQNLRFALPLPRDLGKSLDSVLEVIYLLFNEGYAAHSADDLFRQELCSEALRRALLVADSPVAQPKAHALVSLLAFQAARLIRLNHDTGGIQFHQVVVEFENLLPIGPGRVLRRTG